MPEPITRNKARGAVRNRFADKNSASSVSNSTPLFALPVAAVAHRLVLVFEVLDGHGGVHVEDDLPDGVPLTAMEKEDGRGVAEGADGGNAFHVAALDGFELNGDAGQSSQMAGAALAGESHRPV